MSERADLLIELGCEELPARLLGDQVRLLAEGLGKRLAEAGLIEAGDRIERFATPRRLAIRVASVLERQPDREIERKGPAENVAFDGDNKPTRAAEGFARSVGKTVAELDRVENEQGRWLFARIHEKGLSLSELLPDMLQQTVNEMAGARSMRWSDRRDRFLRPVRWLLVLHGSTVVDLSLFGLASGRISWGHRVHAPGEHHMDAAADYEAILEKAFVLVDPKQRVARIQEQIETLGEACALTPDLPADLLSENAGLTEWPVAVIGSFDPSFLQVPEEAVISSMQQHQKCFPLRGTDGALVNRFIAIANMESIDPAAMTAGFERVIRPRLSDARFFFEQDCKISLADRRSRLDDILFQEKLGSVGDKTRRLEQLVASLAPDMGADPSICQRAAALCKSDLVTEMVGEFPELQGTMGRHYAIVNGEPEAVAAAIEGHYQPRQAGDDLASDSAGQVLALADRLDTVVGIFAAGKKPKSGKDPFALRRAALGIVRLLEHNRTSLTLTELVATTARTFESRLVVEPSVQTEVVEFITDRLRSHATDAGLETNTVHAVAAGKPASVADFLDRARAIQAFAETPAGESLIGANKRTSNLLRQADKATIGDVDVGLLKEDEERVLFDAIVQVEKQLSKALPAADYVAALSALAQLREPVDRFFDAVMVMCEDPALQANRLALLGRLRGLIADIADLAKLGR